MDTRNPRMIEGENGYREESGPENSHSLDEKKQRKLLIISVRACCLIDRVDLFSCCSEVEQSKLLRSRPVLITTALWCAAINAPRACTKDRSRNSNVKERCGLKEVVVTRVEKGMLSYTEVWARPHLGRTFEPSTRLLDGLKVQVDLVAGPFTGLESIVLFYWGAVKEKVYSKAIESEFELRQRIAEAAEFVNNGRFARKIVRSLLKRRRVCIAAEGKHFEHLL
ncbi:hypothetical protein EVAR_40054_1 [Eumeta japonica]|uniref:Uncharacterized protein n=1 Tax=Eumeta variegata TaxID=151549 RepID=A0A4C1W8H0_EUMVA|nr:hypothetical protein EVAR_40054_1 [Eumeta japonica]